MNSDIKTHEKYMRRCIELASRAEGLTYPNPMVGSVVVCDGKIIGEGYHRKAGTPHAEVHTIASVRSRELLERSTIYVCLEPCAHYGRTPPCAKLIIDSKIPRVVVGCVDSFSKVSGKGIEMMREAGIDVTVGVLEAECRELNRRFFTFHEKQRPYIVMKWAESADGYMGKIEDCKARPVWLTNDHSRRIVHKQRTQEAAIMIGVGTAVSDNPSLTARDWAGNNPLRIVVDPNLRMPSDARMAHDGEQIVVFNSNRESEEGNVIYKKINFGTSDATAQMMHQLWEMGIQSVIIEGGSATLSNFIGSDLWDEAWVYRSNTLLGRGVEGPEFTPQPAAIGDADGVRVYRYRNKR